MEEWERGNVEEWSGMGGTESTKDASAFATVMTTFEEGEAGVAVEGVADGSGRVGFPEVSGH